MKDITRFKSRKSYADFRVFLDQWKNGEQSIKSAFLHFLTRFLELDGTRLDFLARPGVSYSLRAEMQSGTEKVLFALVDVVDDDPENRWLSVCFYADAVTDPHGLGNLIPGGILGKDGYCFDISGEADMPLEYLEERIREAFHERTGELG